MMTSGPAGAAPTWSSTCSAPTWTCGPGALPHRTPHRRFEARRGRAARGRVREAGRGAPRGGAHRAARTAPGARGYDDLLPLPDPLLRALRGRLPRCARWCSDWLLAVEAGTPDWPAARPAPGRHPADRGRAGPGGTRRARYGADSRRRFLELVQTGAAPAEIAARLRVAAPVLLPGLGAAPHWQVVVARVEWDEVGRDRGRAGRPVAPGGDPRRPADQRSRALRPDRRRPYG